MGATCMNLPAIFVPGGPDAARQLARPGPRQRHRRVEVLGGAARGHDRRLRVARDRGRHRALARHLHDDGHGLDDDDRGRGARADAAGRVVDPGGGLEPCAAWRPRRGRRIVEMVLGGPEAARHPDAPRPSTTRSRAAMALGGSTNAIIHLIAMARPRRRAARPRALRRALARARRASRTSGPSGEYLMEDFYYAGGLRALLARLARPAARGRADGQRPDARREHRRARSSTTTT